MARAPQQRPALARNFRVDLGKGIDSTTISQVILPRFPAQPEYDVEPLLTLRRAASADRAFHDWWWEETRGGGAKTRTVTVSMLAADMQPAFAWRFSEARPAALRYGLLDATADDVLVETLELAFGRMERV
ncbi:MAG TPA: phage tail protein [Allosphingosinicella sp.]